MPVIAIATASSDGRCADYAARAVSAVEDAGGRVRIVGAEGRPGEALAGAGGLLVPDAAFDGIGGGGAAEGDADAGGDFGVRYGPLLAAALDADLPALLTGRGMHLLNAAFGGQPAAAVAARNHNHEGWHQIYLSPGSKVAAIIGGAGMYRVNSRHRLGLREAQRAPRLMSVAYQLDDGVIEGLESKEHGWVIGVQFLPERRDEVPAAFNSLFLGLVERAAAALRPDGGFS